MYLGKISILQIRRRLHNMPVAGGLLIVHTKETNTEDRGLLGRVDNKSERVF